MKYEVQFFLALAFTIIIEYIVFLVISRVNKKIAFHVNDLKKLGFSVLASGSTLPYVWFVLPVFFTNYVFFNVVAELSVTITESLIYYFLGISNLKNSFWLSFGCNAVSYVIGLLIF